MITRIVGILVGTAEQSFKEWDAQRSSRSGLKSAGVEGKIQMSESYRISPWSRAAVEKVA